MISRDWSPFLVGEKKHAPSPRQITSKEGIGDRLRAAAFAEVQARDAFLWAADRFEDAPPELKEAWRALAQEEDKHLRWLLNRLKELGFRENERPVSDFLWRSFLSCQTAREFALFMASAEERGQRAGEKFFEAMHTIDPLSAEIFRKIAEEEAAHVQLAKRFFN